ncbi:ATP-dependent endonuclease [Leifsonia poae]|uniref:ATP-dependent endonuclease n=1 Tax=Leifsonia poae TaxID=110933 RepID=UPI001CBCF0C0|nr:ATP-dependent endonuclease [Leifsonia poae]
MTKRASIRAGDGELRTDRVRGFERAVGVWLSGAVPARAARVPAKARADAQESAERGFVRSAVLVEGASDRAALRALAKVDGRDLAADGVSVLPMGGAMSIRRFVDALGPGGLGLGLHGMCDAGEVGFFERAGMGGPGFEVCDPDLEGELIRSLGVAAVEAVLDEQGDLRLFRTFQRQPAQRDRSAERQLHRFLGTTSGRKEQYARELVTAAATLVGVTPPAPLRRLLDGV